MEKKKIENNCDNKLDKVSGGSWEGFDWKDGSQQNTGNDNGNFEYEVGAVVKYVSNSVEKTGVVKGYHLELYLIGTDVNFNNVTMVEPDQIIGRA